jgi:hypothetical protein
MCIIIMFRVFVQLVPMQGEQTIIKPPTCHPSGLSHGFVLVSIVIGAARNAHNNCFFFLLIASAKGERVKKKTWPLSFFPDCRQIDTCLKIIFHSKTRFFFIKYYVF